MLPECTAGAPQSAHSYECDWGNVDYAFQEVYRTVTTYEHGTGRQN